MSVPADDVTRGRELRDLAALFLRLGTTAFGGPAAHIAMMRDEVVQRRRWLSEAEFLDLLGATNLIPGPNSTEMAIHVGHRVAGWPGLLVAGTAFIVPAALITLGCAWAYVRFGVLPQVAHLLYGVKPVIMAVVLHALGNLARTAVKGPVLAAVTAAAAAASAMEVNEIVILAAAGVAVPLARRAGGPRGPMPAAAVLPLLPLGPLAVAAGSAAPFSLGALFLFFVKVGSVLFGSGYVLLAFLRSQLVDQWQWLTEPQLLDAVAVGQVTPGPVFTAATFIGYVLGGGAGAGLATLGIFLPAFVFVALSGPLVPRLRRSPVTGPVLDAVNAASLGLMAAVSWHLGHAAFVDVPALVLAAGAAVLLLRFRVNSAWLVLGGGLAGVLWQGWGR